MARVPVYDNFQVLPEGRQGRAQTSLDPRQASVAGDQISQLGKGISGAANTAADLFAKEQEKVNKVIVNDAFNKASAAAQNLKYNKDAGYLRLKGADAVKGIDDKPLADWYGEKLDKEFSGITATLGNPAAREMFSLAASDLKAKFRNEALAYEGEQSSVYSQQVRDATVLQSANDLAADPMGKASAFYVSRARDAAAETARTKGLDGEALDLAVKETMGKVHTSVIETMLEGKNTKGAKAYYEAHTTDFTALDAKTVKNKLDVAYDAAEAIDSVDTVMAKNPLRLNQPVNRSAMDAELRTKYKDDPTGLKAARTELSQRISDHEFQETETNAGNVSAVWKRLSAGESLAQVEGTGAWLSLPGDTQASLKASFLSRTNSGADVTPEAYVAWGALMGNDPELRRMTPNQLAALDHFYGRSLTSQLLTRKRQLTEQQEKAGAAPGKIDNDLFNKLSSDYGVKPFGTDDEKLQAARLRADLETGIAQYQTATGKVVAPADMEQFLRKRAAAFLTLNRLVRPMYEVGNLPTPPEMEQQVLEYMQMEGMDPTPENKRRATLEVFEAGTYLVDE